MGHQEQCHRWATGVQEAQWLSFFELVPLATSYKNKLKKKNTAYRYLSMLIPRIWLIISSFTEFPSHTFTWNKNNCRLQICTHMQHNIREVLIRNKISLSVNFQVLCSYQNFSDMRKGPGKRGHIVADTKCYWTKSETFFVSATNVARAGKWGNICVGNNVSATMCPQQCVLVCQGLKVLTKKHAFNNNHGNLHFLF